MSAPTNLHRVSDGDPGITRRRCGRGFTYRYPSGRTVRSAPVRERIEALAIPPAWTDVWICRDPRGHLQATGRDAKGRKQYRYHPEWRAWRERRKFDRLGAFAERLPALRRQVDQDLRRAQLDRARVTAAAVRLLEGCCMRVGNDAYRRANGTYGLTTLRERHVELGATALHFTFRTKGGAEETFEVTDARAARVLRRCCELPSEALWTWSDADGAVHELASSDVNDYVQRHTGTDATAKTFRIWMGSLHALDHLMHAPAPDGERARTRRFLEAVDAAREVLRNTRAVCRRAYLHPNLEALFMRGELAAVADFATARSSKWLDREEVALKRVLAHPLTD